MPRKPLDPITNKSRPITLTQPQDLIEAAQSAADARGQHLSQWIGEAMRAKLPKEIRDQLGERKGRGRPPKPSKG